jgi:hypothetical protein
MMFVGTGWIVRFGILLGHHLVLSKVGPKSDG